MANIANLSVMISANVSRLSAGLVEAKGKVAGFASTLNPNRLFKGISSGYSAFDSFGDKLLSPLKGALKIIPFVGSALASIPTSVTGLISWYKEGSKSVIDLWKASQRLGLSTETMGAIFYLAGSSAETLEKAMFKMGARIGEVATGSEQAISHFRKLGLDGQALAKMPLDQALGVIADRFKTFANASERAYFAFQIFGKTGSEIIPLLNKGSKGIEDAKKRMKELGLSFNALDAEQVAKADRALKQLDFAIQGVKQQFAIAMAPIILSFIDRLSEATFTASDFAGALMVAVKALAYGGAAALDVWDGLVLALKVWQLYWTGFIVIILTGTTTIIDAFDSLFRAVARFALKFVKIFPGNKLVVEGLKKAGVDLDEMLSKPLLSTNSLKQTAADWWESLDKQRQAFLDRFGNGSTAIQKLDRFFADAERKAKEYAAKMGKDAAPDPSLLRMFELFDKGAKLADEQPLAKLRKGISDLNELATAGAVSYDLYAQQIAKVIGEAEQAAGIGEHKFAQSLQAGSQAAVSTILKAQTQQQDERSQQARIEDLLRAIKEQARIQAENGKQMVDALRGVYGRDI